MKINKGERNSIFNELQKTCNNANSLIEEVMKSAIDYNESWMNNIAEEISDVEGESPEDRIKRIEGIYKRKEKIIGKNEIIRNKLKEGMMMIDNLNISCWKSKRVEKKYPPKHQIEQLEEWTNRKVGHLLFDSDIDNWNRNTSVFGERVMNKEHIIIIIEDEEENKFGGYVNEKIDKVDEWIYDSQSFVFSLESTGRMERMMKFDIKQPQYAFWLYNQSSVGLFVFGGNDILVYKENYKTTSSCKQSSFEYEGIENALCGKQHPNRFTPKRIIVIEMK
ncbi:trichohyalin, putative [Entamoeba histolytica]